jgi:hypothetical protein
LLPEAPLTIAGSGQAPGLSIFPSGGNYNEGIRIHPSSGNGYSVLMLGAVSGVSGTGTGQWGIIDYPSSSSYMFGLRYSGNADALNILTNGSVGIGMIAQELQKVYPQLVTGSKKDYLGINYGAFTAVLLQAIKEQQKEIEELQKKLGMDK